MQDYPESFKREVAEYAARTNSEQARQKWPHLPSKTIRNWRKRYVGTFNGHMQPKATKANGPFGFEQHAHSAHFHVDDLHRVEDVRRPVEQDGSGLPYEISSKSPNDCTITTVTPTKVRTLDDLIKVCEVDTAIWEVESWAVKAYQQGMRPWATGSTQDGWRRDNDEPRITQLFSVTAKLKRKSVEIATRKALDEMIAEAASRVTRVPLTVVAPPKSGYMLGMSLADAHNGKLCWGIETGGPDYDLKLAVAAQERAFETLLARSAHLSFEEILLILGNDGLHVDNNQNTTTKGTPQDVDGRHFKTFGTTWRTYVDQIERLRRIARVRAVIMSGNHDTVSMLHVGDVLTAWFRDDPHVTIDNRPLTRKYVTFGRNLIGVQHGDSGKPAQWAGIMPLEAEDVWAGKHRCILTGHLHTERMEQDEVNGVKIWRVPSLAPPDYWHAKNGYVGNRQAALAFHFHAEDGIIGTAAYTSPAA
jgi:hypothetical protein